jgi:hypothetical protein
MKPLLKTGGVYRVVYYIYEKKEYKGYLRQK